MHGIHYTGEVYRCGECRAEHEDIDLIEHAYECAIGWWQEATRENERLIKTLKSIVKQITKVLDD